MSLHVCMRVKLLQLYLTLCNPMDCNLTQASLSKEFSRQEYWSGLPLPPPGHRMIDRKKKNIYIYIYIYIERERERESTKITQERARCNLYVP